MQSNTVCIGRRSWWMDMCTTQGRSNWLGLDKDRGLGPSGTFHIVNYTL